MKKTILSLCLLFLFRYSFCQEKESSPKVYTLYPWVDIPTIVVGAITNYYALPYVKSKTPLDSAVVVHLKSSDVNWFDRSATWQNAGFSETANTISDYSLNISFLLPAILMFDDKIRPEWMELLVLYLETHAITANIYSLGAARYIDRTRPLVYNPEFAFETRTGTNTRNSFFSGHTSTAAATSFFMAKVYSDFHPELGRKKFLVYSLALIPPAFTGYFRYKASKHFPTDILTGLCVGGAMGILIPQLHKTRPNRKLAIVPFAGQLNGIAMTYKF